MNYKFKTKPYGHQLDALEASWDKENFAYFMEMGTGKSKVLLDNTAILYDKGLINGLLIIAPKGVYKNWYDSEIPTHLPDHIEKNVVLWKTSDKSKKQKNILDTLFKTNTDLHVLIMNVESFSSGDGAAFAYKFLSCHKSMIAIDEATTIKTPTSKRTKNIIALRDHAKYRRILTGSPVIPGDRISRDDGDALLQQTIDGIVTALASSIPYWSAMKEHQQSALISFAFNLGSYFCLLYTSPSPRD